MRLKRAYSEHVEVPRREPPRDGYRPQARRHEEAASHRLGGEDERALETKNPAATAPGNGVETGSRQRGLQQPREI
jgi:hypothetical protein